MTLTRASRRKVHAALFGAGLALGLTYVAVGFLRAAALPTDEALVAHLEKTLGAEPLQDGSPAWLRLWPLADEWYTTAPDTTLEIGQWEYRLVKKASALPEPSLVIFKNVGNRYSSDPRVTVIGHPDSIAAATLVARPKSWSARTLLRVKRALR